MPLKIDRRTKCPTMRADQRTEQQHQRHDDDPRGPGPHVPAREQSAQVRLDQIREVPGDEQRDDPG